MRREKKQPELLKNIVQGLIANLDQSQKPSEEIIKAAWKEIVGETASLKTQPMAIMNKKLKVIVENPGWIEELNYNKRNIIKKLQSKFGKEWIEDIRFQSAG
ncbi:MAG: putative nucleic acid-binding Zn ribbon protein [Candidatus Omnitrophota bacterium]|jgi:predicted nucleic acid-binding Zn ribbon protein